MWCQRVAHGFPKPVPSRHATDVTGSDNARAPCVGDDDRAGDQTNEGLSHPHGRIGQHPKGVGSRSRSRLIPGVNEQRA